MKPGTITHTLGVLLSSISSLFAHSSPAKGEPAKMKLSKRSERSSADRLLNIDAVAFPPRHLGSEQERFPWKRDIVTTVFWIGEVPAGNNPVPNHASSWDKDWAKSYGGFRGPHPEPRDQYLPRKFNPGHDPFFFAPAYNLTARALPPAGAPAGVPWCKRG